MVKLLMITAADLRALLPPRTSNDSRSVLVIRPLYPRFSQALMNVEAKTFTPYPGDIVTWEGKQYKITAPIL